MNVPQSMISEDMLSQFERQGFFILENALDKRTLENLRSYCASGIARINQKMDELSCDVMGINHRDKRYFIGRNFNRDQSMYDYIFGKTMEMICRRVLGPEAYFFLDQFVVKAASQGMSFSWHQDSGYIDFDHEPYLSCWTALDDMTEENGTVYLLPYDELGIRTRVAHIKQEGSNDKVGYFGSHPGIPVIVPAGSIAVFSSVCFHRSGTNSTDKMRRVLLTQYSKKPIVNPVTGKNQIYAMPFYKDDDRLIAPFDELSDDH